MCRYARCECGEWDGKMAKKSGKWDTKLGLRVGIVWKSWKKISHKYEFWENDIQS